MVLAFFFVQIQAIVSDETAVEYAKNRTNSVRHPREKRPVYQLLSEVFGESSVCCWLAPCVGHSRDTYYENENLLRFVTVVPTKSNQNEHKVFIT